MWFLALFGLYVLFDSGFAPFPFFNGNDEELGFYLMGSFILMAIIRYIAIGKHFWNEP